MRKDNFLAGILLFLLAIPVVWFALVVPFERESGDNIVHYYFARYAFVDPSLFLDLWAKPVFTLLASPFAQFGFAGMKLFNGLVGLTTAWIVYRIVKHLGFRLPWLSILLVFFAPTYFTLLFSGYTEPLFGLFLVTAYYLVLRNDLRLAAFCISFIPFVRTEGVLIIAIFVAYFLYRKNWIPILYLFLGPVFIGLAGLLAGKPAGWIITEVPYSVNSNYGSGPLTHYAEQWVLAVGIPLTLSSVAGLLFLFYGLIRKKVFRETRYGREIYLLLPALFLGYFLFHSLSWYFGLFTSYGLIRILVPLIPLQAIFSLLAIQYLLSSFKARLWISYVLSGLFVMYLLIFPFLNNPASVKWKRDFRERPELLTMKQIANDVSKEFPGKFLFYSEPYFSYAFHFNHFDHSTHLNFTELPLDAIRSNSIVLWDRWTSCNFARNVYDFDTIPGFRLIRSYPENVAYNETAFRIYLHE